jgi:predicted DNA-binding protein YlxM (UPF0122 family)
MAKAHNNELMKSISTGYGTCPETQTGGGALREESVDSVKSQINTEKSGVNKMDFKNFDEAKDHYVGEGLSEDDAMKKARELFPEKTETDVEKSLNEKTGLLTKSIEALNNTVSGLKDLFKSHAVEASAQTTPPVVTEEGDEIQDITPFFENLQKSMNSIGENMNTGNTALADTISKTAGAILAIGEMNKSLVRENQELRKSLEDQKKSLDDQAKILKAIANANGFASVLDLDSEIVADETKPKMSKSQVITVLSGLAIDGKIDSGEVTKFEVSGKLPPHLKALPELQVN